MEELQFKVMKAAEVVKCVKQEMSQIQVYMNLQQTHLLRGKADVEECLDHIVQHAESMKRPAPPPEETGPGATPAKRPRTNDDV